MLVELFWGEEKKKKEREKKDSCYRNIKLFTYKTVFEACLI